MCMNVCMDVFIYLLYLCVCITIYYNICMSALDVGIMYVSKLSIYIWLETGGSVT